MIGGSEAINQIRRMRYASLLEASTLALLVFVAVPMKHLGGLPQATAIMGPVHGLAFMIYAWMLIQTLSGAGWARSQIIRMVLFAFIPLAGFLNERLLWHQQQRLAKQTS